MLLGSHLSTAGGLHKALESAQAYGFQALALFVRSPRQWKAPALTDEHIARFRDTRKTSGVKVIVAHASYLINLAGEASVRKKGLAGVTEELKRCNALGVEYLVLHPGANEDTEQGIKRIVEGLNQAMADSGTGPTCLLVEGMAGQGNSIGHRFEHLAEILAGVDRPERFGVCLDTCHMFAAGYDIRSPKAWETTIAEFDSVVGVSRLCAIHCNDSLKPLASRRDRHAHIGEGEIGLRGFRNLVRDQRFKDLPLILETPKERRESDGRDWDEINAETLRGLCKVPARRGR